MGRTRRIRNNWLRAITLVCAGAVGLGASGCTNNKGNGGTGADAAPAAAEPAQTATVNIRSFKFEPAVLEVKPNTAVTWKNGDSADHAVWSGTPDSPKDHPLKGTVSGNGGTYSYTFKEPGEYLYYCDFHHRMTGKVVVK